MTKAATPLISVCICTFRRPEGLRRLLASLHRLDRSTPPVEIIVVDNDAARSAEPIVNDMRAAGLPIVYDVEPSQGIARARSRSVRIATGEVIAFIDDDEEADPMWLVSLWRELTRYGATGVIGRVVPRYRASPPRFARFLTYPTWRTGTVLAWYHTRTSNALVRRSAMARHAGPFDPAFDTMHAEDCELFARMIASGDTFVAVEEAIVYEDVPADRAAITQLLRLYLVNGQIYARVQFRTLSGIRIAAHVARSIVLGVAYASAAALMIPIARATGIQSLLRSALHCGIAFGRLVPPIRKYAWAASPR